MSNNNLPDDLHPMITQEVYLRGLPKIQQKMLHSTSQKTTEEAIKKVNQICNYKAFDKKSLKNQEVKLADLYTKYLLLIHSPSGSNATSMVGRTNNNVLKNSLFDLSEFWNSKKASDYMCYLIKSINFTSGNRNLKRQKKEIVLDFLQDLHNLNLINMDTNILDVIWINYDNQKIHDFLCSVLIRINFNKDAILRTKLEIMYNLVLSLNTYNLIKKGVLNDIILDTVKDNRKKICQLLNNEFNEWLEL